jgi:hypothetical protein
MGSIAREAASKRYVEAFNGLAVTKNDLRGKQFTVVSQRLAFSEGEDVVRMFVGIKMENGTEYEVSLSDDGVYFDPGGDTEDEIGRTASLLGITNLEARTVFKKVRP